MAKDAKKIIEMPNLSAIQKLQLLLRGQKDSFDEGYEFADHLYLPINLELHTKINVKTILVFGPIFAKIIRQGNKEGIFKVKQPLETAQFLLAGSEFLLDNPLFGWSKEQILSLNEAMQRIIERSLNLKEGTLDFIQETYQRSLKSS